MLETPISEMQAEKKSKLKNKFLILGIILGIFILGGVISALATRIWDPLWNPFRPTPQEVIKRMKIETSKLKTLTQEVNFSGNLEGEEGKTNFSFKSSEKINQAQPDNLQSEGTFDISISFTPTMKEFGLMGMGMKFSLAGESKYLDEKLYLKFTTLPSLPFFNLTPIKNVWIRFDEESFNELLREFSQYNLLQPLEDLEKQKKKQKEVQKRIREIIKNANIIVVKKELPDETIGAEKVYHYLIVLDRKELSRAVFECIKAYEEVIESEMATGMIEDEEELKNSLEKFLNKIGEIEGEIWIGKRDYLLYKLKIEKNINLKNFNEEGMLFLRFLMINSDFNSPVKVTPPAKYKTLKEVFEILFSSFLKKEPEPLPLYPNSSSF